MAAIPNILLTNRATVPGPGVVHNLFARAGDVNKIIDRLNSITTEDGQINVDILIAAGKTIVFEGATADAYETTLTVANPTADNTITFPDATGTVMLLENAQTVSGQKTFSDLILYANATGISAFATGGQANATALTEEFNNVTTCATAGDSVKLPAAVAGAKVFVKNSGATALDIFPATGDSIDALAVNLAVRIQPGSTIQFVAKDAIVWESDRDASLTLIAPSTNKGQLEILAADNAGNTVTTITNASQAAARTYTIPDAGGNANFVLTTAPGATVGARCTAQFDATNGTTGTTLTNVTGMSVSVIAGATYTVDVYVGGTSTVNSGMKLALGGTATWTSTDASAFLYTASAVGVGHNATATPGTAIHGTTAANIAGIIKATIVVNAAGTLTLMAAQNAAHADTTSVYVNSYINATRIA